MHHTSKLALILSFCAIIFVVSAIGLVTEYSNIAVITGLMLVFFMTCGFFYATLHLSKLK